MKKKLLAAMLGLSALAGPTLAADASTSLKIVDRITGPDGSWDYANFDPVHRRLYVAHGAAVTAIDVDTGKVTPALVATQKAHSALPLPGGDELLVTNGASNTVTIVNTLTGAIRATIPTGTSPDAALIEPVTGTAVGAIPLDGALEFGVADGQGRVFVNIEDKGEIAVIDAKARKVVAHWPMAGCEEPSGLAYAADAKVLISACANGTAKVLSSTSGKGIASLTIGEKPDAAFYDARRHLAYIPSGGDGTLSVIAVRGPMDVAVIDKVTTKIGARTGALDPVSGKIYLPSADYGAPATPGARQSMRPGSFAVLVLGR
jgi:YVTN family beta-propeller protein